MNMFLGNSSVGCQQFDSQGMDFDEIREFIIDFFFPDMPESESEHWKTELRCLFNDDLLLEYLNHCCWINCNCCSAAHTRSRASKFVKATVYRRRPPVPHIKEWFRLRAALRFHCFGFLLGGILQATFKRSIRAMPARTRRSVVELPREVPKQLNLS